MTPIADEEAADVAGDEECQQGDHQDQDQHCMSSRSESRGERREGEHENAVQGRKKELIFPVDLFLAAEKRGSHI